MARIAILVVAVIAGVLVIKGMVDRASLRFASASEPSAPAASDAKSNPTSNPRVSGEQTLDAPPASDSMVKSQTPKQPETTADAPSASDSVLGNQAPKQQPQETADVPPPPPTGQPTADVPVPSEHVEEQIGKNRLRSKTPAGRPSRSIKVQLDYFEKLLVPRGSKIEIALHDASGKKVATVKTTTRHDAPPYLVEIPIKAALTFPLKLDAELVSRVGHRFSESKEVDEQLIQTQPLELHLQKE
jgi:hypothetical protein